MNTFSEPMATITHADWYGAILRNILIYGRTVGPRGMATREALNVSVRIPMLKNIILSGARSPNYRFMVAEFLWMATGRADLAPLTRYNPHMAKFSDDGVTLAGAYGPWFKQGIGRAFSLLKKDPATRQAFVKIGDPAQRDSKDVPCTLGWQFLIRGGRLHMIANMRSSDAWLGIPYDVYSFSQIGNCVAGALNLEPGDLYLNLASSHLYEGNIAAAEVACIPIIEYGWSDPLDGLPPSWASLVLDEGKAQALPWFATAATTRPEFANLMVAMTQPTSAACLAVLMDQGLEALQQGETPWAV